MENFTNHYENIIKNMCSRNFTYDRETLMEERLKNIEEYLTSYNKYLEQLVDILELKELMESAITLTKK